MKILLEIYLGQESFLYILKNIRRAQTSANAQGYITSPNILITTDHIFINFLTEIHLEPRKSPKYFGNHPWNGYLLQTPAMAHPTRQKLLVIYS